MIGMSVFVQQFTWDVTVWTEYKAKLIELLAVTGLVTVLKYDSYQ